MTCIFCHQLKEEDILYQTEHFKVVWDIDYAKSKFEETPTHHSDHFNTNYAYSVSAYVKGALFLHQLEYIIGEKNVEKTLQHYEIGRASCRERV